MGWVEPSEQVNGNVLDDDLWNQDVVANTLALKAMLDAIAPIGQVVSYVGDTTALLPYWLPCDGTIIPGDDRYQTLRDRIGHTFDQPDLREYRLPDLRGRSIIGTGYENVDHNPLDYLLGQKHGDRRMQYHGHSVNDGPHQHNYGVRGDGSSWNAANNNAGPPAANLQTDLQPANISIVAAGEGHAQNIPPSLVVHFIILAAIE